MNNAASLKFFWNGIKANGGKLQKASFCGAQLRSYPTGTITIYAKDHAGFSAEVAQSFEIQNDSDGQTDYFEKDRIRVQPSHSLYSQVKSALAAGEAHYEKRFAKAGM